MKKLLTSLMQLCPGKLIIEIDYHKQFGEDAKTLIEREERRFQNVPPKVLKIMISSNTIIQIEAYPKDKPMEAISYHYDIESALKDVLNQINLWQPQSN